MHWTREVGGAGTPDPSALPCARCPQKGRQKAQQGQWRSLRPKGCWRASAWRAMHWPPWRQTSPLLLTPRLRPRSHLPWLPASNRSSPCCLVSAQTLGFSVCGAGLEAQVPEFFGRGEGWTVRAGRLGNPNVWILSQLGRWGETGHPDSWVLFKLGD